MMAHASSKKVLQAVLSAPQMSLAAEMLVPILPERCKSFQVPFVLAFHTADLHPSLIHSLLAFTSLPKIVLSYVLIKVPVSLSHHIHALEFCFPSTTRTFFSFLAAIHSVILPCGELNNE